ncbi:hypothetical protein C8J57DRAFT_1538492 [Mycena rebaudengoi]|nr:hypothetical protein C8J57DRAFT_1538492 [Mycena rebaudengoi]
MDSALYLHFAAVRRRLGWNARVQGWTGVCDGFWAVWISQLRLHPPLYTTTPPAARFLVSPAVLVLFRALGSAVPLTHPATLSDMSPVCAPNPKSRPRFFTRLAICAPPERRSAASTASSYQPPLSPGLFRRCIIFEYIHVLRLFLTILLGPAPNCLPFVMKSLKGPSKVLVHCHLRIHTRTATPTPPKAFRRPDLSTLWVCVYTVAQVSVSTYPSTPLPSPISSSPPSSSRSHVVPASRPADCTSGVRTQVSGGSGPLYFRGIVRR